LGGHQRNRGTDKEKTRFDICERSPNSGKVEEGESIKKKNHPVKSVRRIEKLILPRGEHKKPRARQQKEEMIEYGEVKFGVRGGE